MLDTSEHMVQQRGVSPRPCVWLQVVVQLAVDKSRNVCSAVAKGDIDVAIIGGHVPEELKDILRVCTASAGHLSWC